MSGESQKIEDDAFEILIKQMYGDMQLPDDLKQQIRTAMETGQVAPQENEIPPKDREPIDTNALANDLSNVLGKVRDRQEKCCGDCG